MNTLHVKFVLLFVTCLLTLSSTLIYFYLSENLSVIFYFFSFSLLLRTIILFVDDCKKKREIKNRVRIIINAVPNIKDCFIEEQCSICIEDLKENVVAVKCKHTFHQKCITSWLTRSTTCPLCRQDLSERIEGLANV